MTCFSLKIVEYWRNRYQRMNYDRFVAANGMALITHTLVSSISTINLIVGLKI